MSKKDFETEEMPEEILEENEDKIPVNDKRKFSADGERLNKEADPPPPVKSMRETELENRLREETARREAAETKLVGVQAKFEEVKAEMERETQEMRERMRKSLEDRAKQGQFSFLTTLLPVLDNLSLAIDHAEKDPSVENLLGGVKGTARSFEQALLSVGVEAVPSIGTDFNPEIHEAIDMIETDPENDGKITAEYSRGYKFGDRLLRPARVQVGRGRAQKAGE
ncbi:MAG: nucleotide exchange factor GrpE [Acidobacteria bacterium]|nr:nucleotide exchange factor GrpE [Acidobacteriota bacterium]